MILLTILLLASGEIRKGIQYCHVSDVSIYYFSNYFFGRSSVQEKVAKEMEIFLQQLGTNERSNTKRIQVALDKTERISKSILELSEVSSAAIDDVISDAEETKVMITNLRKELLADMSELREVMMSNQNAAQETLNDLHQRCADERFHSILKNVSDMKETVESLKTELLFDPDELRLNSHVMKGTTNQVVASIIQKLGRSSTFTENGQDPVTILPLLDKHSEAIRVTTTLLKNVEERVAAVGVLQAKSQLQEEELLYEIKALQKHREDMEVASRTTIQAQAHITGLNDRSLEHNTAIAQIEGHLKSVQNDIANVSAISFENEARLLAVSKDVAGFESRILGVIDVIKAVCLEFITEKHEELVKRCIFL